MRVNDEDAPKAAVAPATSAGYPTLLGER